MPLDEKEVAAWANGITEDEAKEKLGNMLTKAKRSLGEMKTKRAYDFVLNEFILWAQKYLYVLKLPVDWLQQELLRDPKFANHVRTKILDFDTYIAHGMTECLVCQHLNNDGANECAKCHNPLPKKKLVASDL